MFRFGNIRLIQGLCSRFPAAPAVRAGQWRWCSNEVQPLTIDDVIKRNPKVAFYGQECVERFRKQLLKVGFTDENIAKVVDGYPEALRLSPRQVSKSLEAWHVCNFSPTQFYELFAQCPELLEFDDEQYIASRFAELEMFAYTPKNIWRLFMSSPNVLVDDIKQIKEKVSYILNDMEADETDMVKSGVLGLSLDKIKARHVLLVRLGLYKKRNWKASEMDPNKNPRMFRIMDCSDQEFATKTCGGLSIKELEAFYDLFERELKEKKQEALEYEEFSDSDSDETDDEEFDARQNEDFYDDRHRRRYQTNRHSKVKKEYRRKPIY